MTEPQFRFDDGAAYEEMMGKWSRSAGEIFLDWLAPPPALRWIDIGCGNGAFTELLVDRCAPAEVAGVDPSEGQLAFARTRPAGRVAQFQQGHAMALPFPDHKFDAATMALVIFFVPEPARGVAEMVRVVRPGGIVAAYAWDMFGGGFPLDPILVELRAMNLPSLMPPSADASRMEALRGLWSAAGLEGVETRKIAVQRTFADFDAFWAASVNGSNAARIVNEMTPSDVEVLKSRVRARLPIDAAGHITYGAHANAVKGRVPA